jgi:Exostosin family
VKVFIPDSPSISVGDKELFILTRPFKTRTGWGKDDSQLERWGLRSESIWYMPTLDGASLLLLPYSINQYCFSGKLNEVELYAKYCTQYGVRGYAYVSGDWGIQFPEFEGLTYFRMSGFRSQLSNRNQGFPVSLSDQLLRIFRVVEPAIREKQDKPTIGFCGHASLSVEKKVKEQAKFMRENVVRALRNPFRQDWEPIFPSAWHRAYLLGLLEQSGELVTNFIYREQYRGGATTDEMRDQTTREYYNNLRDSDYVLCVRGGGNFSVRLYETLMMGRIPVFVNTDCLLPFPAEIDWKRHVVWVEWNERASIAKKILEFHKRHTASSFMQLQKANRELWLNQLSVAGIYRLLAQAKEGLV